MFAATIKAMIGSRMHQPSQQRQQEPGDHAKTGPGIGEDVLSVCYKDQRSCFAAGANEIQSQHQVDY